MVQKIDETLLRKRAEHNDGELSTLKEVSLHQFDIEKIENLDTYCRHLEILYLQSNQISKIENLHKLKNLDYLQLALNNIKIIENLAGCESLRKLDLTVNFVEDLFCLESLKGNEMLRELYLVGNPCTDKPGYRLFIIETLPQLTSLDGKEIEKSERILAAQQYASIRQVLLEDKIQSALITTESSIESLAPAAELTELTATESLDTLESRKLAFNTQKTKHTPESRLEAAHSISEFRSTPRNYLEPLPVVSKPTHLPCGRLLQRNDGKWIFSWTETSSSLILSVAISKYLDTSLIDIDILPQCVTITIKGKILRLDPQMVVKTDAICERSSVSGELVVTMLKADVEGDIDVIRAQERSQTELKTRADNEERDRIKKEWEGRGRRYEGLKDPVGTVDYKNIVKDVKEKKRSVKSTVVNQIRVSDVVKIQEEFVDDPDVPPLW